MNLLTLNPLGAAINSGTVSKVLRLTRAPRNLILHATFLYGSGGTSNDAYVQTSIDEGVGWIDIAQFHFTTSSARALYALNSQTPITTLYVPTDGTLSANTSKDGILGELLRVKYGSVGTYAGLTSLSIDAITDQS